MKKAISILLVLVLLISLAPLSVFAAGDEYETITGTVMFNAGHDDSKTDHPCPFTYSDEYFTQTGYNYRQDLATVTMAMCFAAGNVADPARYKEGPANLIDFFDQIGFKDFEANRDYTERPGRNTFGVGIANKVIYIDGEKYTVIGIGLRGCGYYAEWAGDLNVGLEGDHTGFAICRDTALAFLKDYLAKHTEITGKVKLWCTGYSRGAAVANLLAARVNKELPGLERENVFVYTFATPVALGPQDYPDLQQDYDNNHNADGSLKESWGESNIFNIISSGDIVPHLLPEEWSFHRNGNDRFLPSTRNEEELEDLNEMGKNDFGPTPLDFSWLATDKETNEVMLSMEEYFISRENYHEKYEAALMDMIQCAFIRSEKEVTQNKVLDDGEVIQRLRTLTHLKNMDYWKISRAVWAASTMSRAVLKRVDVENIPIRAQQIVVPILAVGLCYGLESEAVSLIAKYILMFVSMRSAPDNAIRAAFCHHFENYIALMEYYAPSEHCMEATTRT